MARAWLGTSGFAYKEWRSIFYPEKLPEKQFLAHYATRLDAVEIDSTFYRMPTVKTIDAWRDATPEHFRFAIKASQRITHRERLGLPSESLDYLLKTVPGLGPRLGAVLYQLPPFLRCDLPRFEAFLQALPRSLPSAFEFRHESWRTDRVHALLGEHGAALCINDGDDGTTPLEITAPFTYLRLRRSAYSPEERSAWQARIREWVARGVEVLAFIKHQDNPEAPLIALEFAAGLADPAKG
jgi:uncharacterized protein YecE (DUF72 family)